MLICTYLNLLCGNKCVKNCFVRYAHQLVYESETGMHYLFGGNPGGKEGKQGKIR